MKAITSGSTDQELPNEHILPTMQTEEEAIACDPIAMAHAAICAICSSTTHSETFIKTIIEENQDGRFGCDANGDPVQLDNLQLL